MFGHICTNNTRVIHQDPLIEIKEILIVTIHKGDAATTQSGYKTYPLLKNRLKGGNKKLETKRRCGKEVGCREREKKRKMKGLVSHCMMICS